MSESLSRSYYYFIVLFTSRHKFYAHFFFERESKKKFHMWDKVGVSYLVKVRRCNIFGTGFVRNILCRSQLTVIYFWLNKDDEIFAWHFYHYHHHSAGQERKETVIQFYFVAFLGLVDRKKQCYAAVNLQLEYTYMCDGFWCHKSWFFVSVFGLLYLFSQRYYVIKMYPRITCNVRGGELPLSCILLCYVTVVMINERKSEGT